MFEPERSPARKEKQLKQAACRLKSQESTWFSQLTAERAEKADVI